MTIQEHDGRAVLQPEGELTIFEAAELREGFLALRTKEGELELSLANIERIDSSSVQLVIAACQEMTLHITGASAPVQEQFEVIGCGNFLKDPVRPSDE